MKNTILFPLILAGLALAGCNSSTRSSTAAATATPEPVATVVAAPMPIEQTAAHANPADPALTDPGATPLTSSRAPIDSTFASNVPPTVPLAPDQTPLGVSATDTKPAGSPVAITGASTVTPGAAPTEPSSPDQASPAATPVASSPAPGALAGTATTPDRSTSDATADAARRTADYAATTTADLTTRLTEWRLSDAEIQADLDSGIAIVRTKDSIVGAPTGSTDDDLLKTMIKGKFMADHETAKAMIEVAVDTGEATLKGSADSASQIGRAIALALDTPGVTKVSSELKVNAKARNQN